jgi:hypothetical protein
LFNENTASGRLGWQGFKVGLSATQMYDAANLAELKKPFRQTAKRKPSE